MRTVDLPVLPAGTPLESALATMYAARRAGVVTVCGDDVRLVHARGVMDAIAAGDNGTLADITDGGLVSTELAPLRRSKSLERDWKIATSTSAAEGAVFPPGDPEQWYPVGSGFDDYFRANRGERFLLAELSIGAAIVITSSEKYGDPLAFGPSQCRCTDTDTPHYYPKANHPQLCDFDQTQVNC